MKDIKIQSLIDYVLARSKPLGDNEALSRDYHLSCSTSSWTYQEQLDKNTYIKLAFRNIANFFHLLLSSASLSLMPEVKSFLYFDVVFALGKMQL